MEFNRSFDNDPSAAGGPDSRPRRHEFSRLTGLLTVEASQSAEQRPTKPIVRAPESVIAAALGGQTEEAPAAKEEHSEWHSYKVDEKGQVIDQRASMGQAFLRELQPEQMMTSSSQQDDDTADAAQLAVQSQLPVQPAQTVQPLVPSPQAPAVPNLSQAAVPTTPISPVATATQPIVGASPEPIIPLANVPQPDPQPPVFGSTVPLVPSTPPMQSRRFTPPPTASEPLLTPGASTHVDAQHLLPAPKNKLAQFFTSPWFWLCFGLFLIFYFSVLQ